MVFTVDPAPRQRLPLYKTVLCIACALILVVNGVSLFHNLQSLKDANSQLARSARVADRLQHINVLILDAESNLRSYFLSGSATYLRPTNSVAVAVEDEFKTLHTLLADSPVQLTNLAQLRTLAWRRMGLMDQALELYRQGGLPDIVNVARSDDGRAAMDEMRLQVVIMVKEQNETLAARSAAFYDEYQKALVLGVGINAVAILVLLMFYQAVRRGFEQRAKVELALQSANDSLETMVAKRTEQLAVLSRHLITVNEDEKSRLARELHDELGANLTSINMDLAAVLRDVKDTRPELAKQLLHAKETLLDTVALKRRIVEDLRPSALDNLGLCTALQNYCGQFSSLAKVHCEIDLDIAIERSEATLSIALFRIVQESLTNIMKYAEASNVSVSLKRGASGLMLRILDDGIGIADDTLSKPMTHGLLGMRERALLLGGSLTIRRGRNSRGTCIEAAIPLPAPQGVAPAPVQLSSGQRRRADDRIPSLLPYNIPPHAAPSLDGR
ncbi:MAG: CHASE3 domain-containing protein [Pseudomonadota bacterium]